MIHRDSIVRQYFPDGAFAEDRYGSLSVSVPEFSSHQRARSDARIFARSIWGPSADVHNYLGKQKAYDETGRAYYLRKYSVIVKNSKNEELYGL